MHNNIRSACRRENGHRKQKQRGGGRCTWRGGGDAAGRTTSLVVLWWRPVAVSWLTDGSSKKRRCCFKRRRERFFLFPSLTFSSLFFCFLVVSPLSSWFVVKFPTPFKAFPSSPFGFINGSLLFSSFSLLGSFSISLRFLSFLFLFLCAGVQSPFIGGKGSGASLWLHGERGSAGRLASGCDWQGAAPSTFHHESAWGGGFGRHVACRVQRGKKKKKCLPLLHVQGKEKGEQCRSKRHCSALFFF